MYFSELQQFLNELRARKLKSFETVGIVPRKLISTPSKKVVKCKNVMNSSFINNIAPPGNFLFLSLSTNEKNLQALYYSIYFMVIIKYNLQLWFVIHSDWLRTCLKRTSLIHTWALLRTRIPQVVFSHYVGHSYVAETSLESQGKTSSH